MIVGDFASERLSRFLRNIALECCSPPSDITYVRALQLWLQDLADCRAGAIGCKDEISVQAAASAFKVVKIHRDLSIGIFDVRDVLPGGIYRLPFACSGFLG